MRTLQLIRKGIFLLGVASIAGWVPSGYAAVEDLAVTDITLVSSSRVGRTINQYVFTATVSNPAEPLENVVATVTSSSGATVIIDGEVVLGSLASGTTTPTDTITLNHNRRYRFDETNLVWSFTGETPNTAPIADAGPDQQVATGVTVLLDGSGSTDPDNDPLTYLWNLNVPAGSAATLSDPTAESPTFPVDVAGAYTATLTVSDGTDASAPDAVEVIAVFAGDNPPAITSAPGTAADVGGNYVYNVIAVDPDVGDILTYALQLSPETMVINPATGVINWTPDASGQYDVDVLVTDSTGLTARQIYLLTVTNGQNDQPPLLAPIADETTVINQVVTTTASATDPEGEAVQYSIAGPDGISINSVTGEVFWTPSAQQVGQALVTVTARDPGGLAATTQFGVTVLSESPNSPPVIDPVADRTLSALDALQITFSATDPDPGDILTFSVSGTPNEAQFDPASGTLSWVANPSDVGTFSATATVTDSAGNTDATGFNITVIEPPAAPVAVDDRYTIDRDLVLIVPAPGVLENDTDANNDPLTAANTNNPSLGTLDNFPGDGSFVYTPPAVPPITIGLEQQCEVTAAGMNGSIAVGDVDNDGVVELVGSSRIPTNNEGFTVVSVDGNNCVVENEFGLNQFGGLDIASHVGLLDIDGDNDLEIIGIRAEIPGTGQGDQSHLIAFHHDGAFAWASETLASDPSGGISGDFEHMGPTFVDLDGNGTTEIVMAFRVGIVGGVIQGLAAYSAIDGTVLWEWLGTRTIGEGDFGAKPPTIVDLDLDGTPEIITSAHVVSHLGTEEFILPSEFAGNGDVPVLTVAVANFDTDPFPELIARDENFIYRFNHDGQRDYAIPYINSAQGQIVIADFDGDSAPEYAFSGQVTGSTRGTLQVFDADGTQLWSHEGIFEYSATQHARAPAIAAFDFNRDGQDELVAEMDTTTDPALLYIFDGSDGTLIDSVANNVGSVEQMHPVIADVDADGAAELITSANNAFVRVWQGLAGNPFAPARPIRNQWVYVPTHVNPDATIPPEPRPHWLVPGLNSHLATPVLPEEDPGANDQFNYLANDGNADSNEATVSLTITDVNAPTIVSTPPVGASPDFPYQYGALATDADFGDIFTWSLVDAPTNMTVDANGLVEWLPEASDLGAQRVHLVVTDTQGNADEQSFTIDVVPPVTVPDVVTDNEAGAAAALEAAGLAVGSVTQSFSLTVPAGQVISQSIVGGQASAAGAFVNIVISLGPQPIFVPNLADLGQSAADALLESVALDLGVVTFANSDAVPRGLVISQSELPNSEVTAGTLIDVVISGGPTLAVTLGSTMVQSGDAIPLTVVVFDSAGVPQVPQPAVTVTVTAEPNGAIGTLPTANQTEITTFADSEGGYTLDVDAGALGTMSKDFLVLDALNGSTYFEPIADFATLVDNVLPQLQADLLIALRENDVIAIQALGQQLVAIRASIDVEVLSARVPFAPTTGFLPNYDQSVAAGFPASFGEIDLLPANFASVANASQEVIAFLSSLNGAVARDDDVRARALNDVLDQRVDVLRAINMTPGGHIRFKSEINNLVSRIIPQMVVADLDASIQALTDAGLIASASPGAETINSELPETLFAQTRPAFFTLTGLMSASSIRNKIIKKVYVPYIKEVVASGLVLATADALVGNPQALPLAGIVTGASVSFHSFRIDPSIVEGMFQSNVPSDYEIGVVGPDAFDVAIDALMNLASVDSPQAFLEAYQGMQDTVTELGFAFRLARPSEVIRGCLFESNPDCREISLQGGFPVVHSSGSFPAPVVVIVTDNVTFETHFGVFAFFPN